MLEEDATHDLLDEFHDDPDAWSVAGYATYQVFESWDIGAGWRTIKIDRDFGDVRMEGPLVGFAYRF